MHAPRVVTLLVRAMCVVLALCGSLPASARAAQDAPAPASVKVERVRASLHAGAPAVEPGGAVPLAVVLEFDKGWHAWPSQDQDVLPKDIAEFAIRTSAALADPVPAWASTGPVQWPTPTPAQVGDINNPGAKITVPLYKDRAIIYLPVRISPDAPRGEQRLSVIVGFQACDDKICLAPEELTLSVPMTIGAPSGASGAAPTGAQHSAIFEGFDASRLQAPAASTSPTPAARAPAAVDASAPRSGSTFFGVSLDALGTGPLGWIGLALLAALGGFILNLTPCVLPVIPIKVLTLTQHAASPRESFMLGLWMALGVVAFWLALGIPAAFVAGFADPSIIFGVWWLTAGIGLVIGLMGLGIMGLFSINLPQQLYMVNPEANSPGGSFMFGVMTAVLGLPCFGFVAGALLPAAATIGPAATIVVFGAMGVGMAAPYLVLAAKPSLLKHMPRTGPASELVKQVMGLLLLAAAAYFIGSGVIALVQDHPYLAKRLHWWVAAILGVVAGAWLTIRTLQITPSTARRAFFGAIGLVLALGGVAAAWSQTSTARREYDELQESIAQNQEAQTGAVITGAWQEYSEPLVQRALAQGKVVVMDFTAEWCLNCKTLKAAVLDVAPVKPALRQSDVVLIEVDLTSRRAKGWDKLKALGQTGIPLLAIQGPGGGAPALLNAYTSTQVLEALDLARQSKSPAAPPAQPQSNAP